MNNIGTKLLSILNNIEGSGDFETSGVKNMMPLGLHIESLGEIGFPIPPIQTRELIKLARKAPFGKGSQTVLDTNVRSAWEIDADKISFRNAEWKDYIGQILKKVKKGLGIEERDISASLYKLLIYEKGDFFLPHKDSEKEKGMFASLVIGLPSKHEGGVLYIRFDGREEAIDFSIAANNYKMPYVAFFADCEHEIKPVTSGYRICLVYNLIQKGGSKRISSPQFISQTEHLAAFLKTWEAKMDSVPKAVLLGHQYTPANFSENNLKLHDKPRATALMEAAERAGYFARLGLVTSYLMGELEEDYNYYRRRRRGRYYYDDEDTEGSMGEIYDSSTSIDYWIEGETPGLGNLDIDEKDIITDVEMAEGEPTEQDQEGYTGNAGMTIEYWYHYGAVILWPKSRHFDLLKNRPIEVQLNWLKFYQQHWNNKDLHSQGYAKQLIVNFTNENLKEGYYERIDFSIVAVILSQLQDEDFIKNNCIDLLVSIFGAIKVENWLNLLKTYSAATFIPIFQKVGFSAKIDDIHHSFNVLQSIIDKALNSLDSLVSCHIELIPDYLKGMRLSPMESNDRFTFLFGTEANKEKSIMAIIEQIISFSKLVEDNEQWQKAALANITKSLPRKFVNETLVPILLSRKYKDRVLAKALHQVCLNDLKKRTEVKPSPPPNWSRSIPPNTGRYNFNKKIWDILSDFLKSPTQQVFDYTKNESYRKEMERAINSVTIDLSMETLKNSRPYTLRLTKTQAAYEKDLKRWKEDDRLLEALKKNE